MDSPLPQYVTPTVRETFGSSIADGSRMIAERIAAHEREVERVKLSLSLRENPTLRAA